MLEPAPRRAVRVKICGITRAEDALAAEAAGADAIGLIFAPGSSRRVDPRRARTVCEALPPFVSRVGVFRDADEDEVEDTALALGLDAVQLHGAAAPEVLARLRRRVRVVRALRFRPGLTPRDLEEVPCDAILLDGPESGSGTAFDWSAAAAWHGHPRLVLAGGLRPETVADAVAALAPYAVDVASGVEAAPGTKDPARIRAFVQAARARAVPL